MSIIDLVCFSQNITYAEIAVVGDKLTQIRCLIAYFITITALATYDYFLTLPSEVNEIWSTPFKFTLVKVLYLVNRYTFIGVLATLMASAFWNAEAGVTLEVSSIYFPI